MADGVENRRQSRCIESLDPSPFEQSFGRKGGQYAIAVGHHLAKPGDELSLRVFGAVGRFTGPVAHIRFASDSMQNPLPQVSAQVQKNILNAVVRGMLPPVQVGVAQLLKTVVDFLEGAGERRATLRQEGCADRRIVMGTRWRSGFNRHEASPRNVTGLS